MASITKENYIKAIFFLHQKDENISLTDIGTMLDVKKPTASDMVGKLSKENIVISEKYKPIRITEHGKRLAASIIRKHRLSEMFLSEVMQFGWEEVHEIAEELEHIKIDKFFDRMDELLGYPATDPHGSPIPDKEGNFNRIEYVLLPQVEVGSTCTLKALKDSSTDFLLYLNKKDLSLETEMKIVAIEEFDGSTTVQYGDREEVLGKLVCDRLLVERHA